MTMKHGVRTMRLRAQALHFACIGGYLDVCGKLIQQKAYVEARCMTLSM